jgi:hypothetical protein
VSTVVFDVGETIVDETRHSTELAHAASVTPFTLMAVLGATMEAGGDHRTVWDRLAPMPEAARASAVVDHLGELVDGAGGTGR